MPVKNRLADLHADITAWRRDIHAHPEILYDTHRTSALVADKLRDFGCDEVVTGIGRTGVVGVIRGKTDTKGSVIGLRADMDALPMQEQTGLDYASTIPGAMHACGHDGHTAMVLGAARYLTETRNFDGTVVVIFQPAEEGGNGALAMVEDGMMERWGIQEVYGLHNSPGLPAGQFAIRPGALMAAVDFFEITVQGRGGHAAKPQETVDTTVLTSQMIVAMQTVVSRNMDPVEEAVLSFTAVDTSSHAFNVIPDRATLRGTVRSHSEEVRDRIEARMGEVVSGIAHTMGGTATLDYRRQVPVTVNAEEQASFAAEIAREISGGCNTSPLIMGGEDFSYMLQARPGAFIFLGNGETAALHHPEYNFNDDIIPVGCSYFAELVERRMPAA
ncbi:M20 aminoacylase family protein [Aestuariivita sp.]|jgi:hippurate hydrolase|uniref:M20 aminoacylase family protein n=1 Tax=Aestuariivita sp. TaxID=1872407 RepID=UPI00216DC095|nr:M20 aminoacylase family protein [Aestuariivita sp.]MCE8008859.1 amidohydrolase [Aestuariivita sp.]